MNPSPDLDLKRLTLLAELEASEQEAIAEELEILDLDAGVELFAEGEQGDGLYFVVAGGVRVESARADHAVEFSVGSSLGAFSLVASGPRSPIRESMRTL